MSEKTQSELTLEIHHLEIALAIAEKRANDVKAQKATIEADLEKNNPEWASAKQALTEANKALTDAETAYKQALTNAFLETGQLPMTPYALVSPTENIALDVDNGLAVTALIMTFGVNAMPYLSIRMEAITNEVLEQAGVAYHINKGVKPVIQRKLLQSLIS